jgi:uncharacterized protein (TIGR02118 family)
MGGAHAYVTREHVQKMPATAPPLGARSPGVKIVGLVRRPDGMTHDAFVEHWLHRHVPLALRHHPGLHRYVTNVVEQRVGDAPDWDGIAELCFPSVEAMRMGFFDSPEGERIIREDMTRFIGLVGYDVAEWCRSAGASQGFALRQRPLSNTRRLRDQLGTAVDAVVRLLLAACGVRRPSHWPRHATHSRRCRTAGNCEIGAFGRNGSDCRTESMGGRHAASRGRIVRTAGIKRAVVR